MRALNSVPWQKQYSNSGRGIFEGKIFFSYKIVEYSLNAAVNDAIDNPKLGLNKNDIPAAYPAGNAYNAESNPFLRHK